MEAYVPNSKTDAEYFAEARRQNSILATILGRMVLDVACDENGALVLEMLRNQANLIGETLRSLQQNVKDAA